MTRRAARRDLSREPLRVLQIHRTFDLGGKEARLARLMNHWGGRMQHDILLAEPGATGAQALLDPTLKVRFLDSPALEGPATFARFNALAKAMRGYDLILSFNWGAIDGVMAHRLFRRLRCLPPLIHHEEGFDVDEAFVRQAARNRYRQIALQGARALVVPSAQLAHIAQAEWRQPAEKVHQIPNGLDVAAYEGTRPVAAIPGLVPDGRLIVGTVANLRAVKNLPRLVRAVAPLRDRLRLVIVGDGEEREAILAEAQRQGMHDLLMPGALPRPQDYVGAFDIFALSSDSEQFPTALMEAMAAGLPVVATDVGDTLGMVAPDNRPFIVAPDATDDFQAALAELAGDADLRRTIGAANRDRARRCFDEAVMIQLYARLYGEAVGNELALF
ncbi:MULTISPECIES: glycosyltransferase family 4 protein [Sphingobium]|uniref:glycosyltransferase family 4 protein n=1 Tax=Sphingobium TaxID=165695 RepID=UPI0015EB77B6|nr:MULTISPECIES: glycosyltransferase family 4 protein [Sphingobium]MCW2364125.1 glycosyltransferase involved in cell wall biosynthesis [Sphingobium sp. B10D3B]MCW2402478.1 glycosyltransferase involved in cell wall biosynthesis [Sphingobium sp. B10D7B]MCW2409457.1 glycosyltransferase involved in cell wall biosynthesis [Sphingobium xanthum]